MGIKTNAEITSSSTSWVQLGDCTKYYQMSHFSEHDHKKHARQMSTTLLSFSAKKDQKHASTRVSGKEGGR